jgi:hypothetical protein
VSEQPSSVPYLGVRFTNGPAREALLQLERTPRFLRVVQNDAGSWDALDKPNDTVRPDEKIYVYALDREPCVVYVDYTERGRRVGKRICVASYSYYAVQPIEDILANNEKWQQWCVEEWDAMVIYAKMAVAREEQGK